jgi:hypothetical protein
MLVVKMKAFGHDHADDFDKGNNSMDDVLISMVVYDSLASFVLLGYGL